MSHVKQNEINEMYIYHLIYFDEVVIIYKRVT